MSATGLAHQLAATNGWVRDAAQRLLSERKNFVAGPVLERIAAEGRFPAAIHALWVLNAWNSLSTDTLLRAMASTHPKVRATAIRVSESLLNTESSIAEKVRALAKDESADVQLQVMFTLGQMKSPETDAVMTELLHARSEHPLIRDAAITGLQGRELPFLGRLVALPGWSEKTSGRERVLRDLARAVAETREGTNVTELLEMTASQKQRWVQYALLDGIAALIPSKGKGKEAPTPKPVRLVGEPPALATLASIGDDGVTQRLKTLEPLLAWSGKPGMVQNKVAPLTEEEKKLMEAGKAQYTLICGACHQPNGLGLDGLAPPLVDSDWVTGSPARLTRIALNGVRGPLNVKGKVWELEMPPVNILTDKEIAGILTYIRREWGHAASAVSPDYVASVRKETEARQEAWTEPELLKVQ
jgi:mono/diheme cytochrome c family protein